MKCSLKNLMRGALAASLIVAAGGALSTSSTPVSAAEIPDGAVFVPVSPQRIFDTRTGVGFDGVVAPVGANSTTELAVTETDAGVPASAVGIALNLTYRNAGGDGYLTVYPAGEALPNASNLNKVGAGPVANYLTVPLGENGQIAIYNFGAATDMIGDLAGYYMPGTGAVGPQGEPGTPGDAGQPGTPGMSGYEIVTAEAGYEDGAIALCSPGKKVVGGAWAPFDPYHYWANYPASDGSGWILDSAGETDRSGGIVTAICVSVSETKPAPT